MTEYEKVKRYFERELMLQPEESVESLYVEEIKDICLKVVEEIQQYRGIGTVEEFKALKEKNMEKNKRCDCGGYISRFNNNRCLRCGALHAIRN